MTHLDRLERIVGSLSGKGILDLGSGKGDFLLMCVRKGYRVSGLELSSDKIAIAQQKAYAGNLVLRIVQGHAEETPFPDESFDFINISEVIEHVQSPVKSLAEVFRMLKRGGRAYVSIHNRFAWYDSHFHTYFLGWLPRSWGEKYLSLLGKHKLYANGVDRQRISEMHYFTYGKIKNLLEKQGFKVQDIREQRIRQKIPVAGGIFVLLYRVFLRPWYFNTFHLLITKSDVI